MTTDPVVYRSDAAWAAHGNRSGTRYHWPNPTDPALAACGLVVLDLDYSGRRPADVAERLRCKRRACARRYEAEAPVVGEGNDAR